jgi:hypothetical protein
MLNPTIFQFENLKGRDHKNGRSKFNKGMNSKGIECDGVAWIRCRGDCAPRD